MVLVWVVPCVGGGGGGGGVVLPTGWFVVGVAKPSKSGVVCFRCGASAVSVPRWGPAPTASNQHAVLCTYDPKVQQNHVALTRKVMRQPITATYNGATCDMKKKKNTRKRQKGKALKPGTMRTGLACDTHERMSSTTSFATSKHPNKEHDPCLP